MQKPNELLVEHLNSNWPKRNKDFDEVKENAFIFHKSLDGKISTTKDFVNHLILLAKSGQDNNSIKLIRFDGKIASGEYKNKFWSWEDDQASDVVEIVFHENSFIKSFEIVDSSKEKVIKKTYPQFPGVNSLQYKRKNKSVKVMQEQLNKMGFYVSEKELGYYGKETCEAVKAYYRKTLGINSGTIVKDGKKIGPKAWKRLFD